MTLLITTIRQFAFQHTVNLWSLACWPRCLELVAGVRADRVFLSIWRLACAPLENRPAGPHAVVVGVALVDCARAAAHRNRGPARAPAGHCCGRRARHSGAVPAAALACCIRHPSTCSREMAWYRRRAVVPALCGSSANPGVCRRPSPRHGRASHRGCDHADCGRTGGADSPTSGDQVAAPRAKKRPASATITSIA